MALNADILLRILGENSDAIGDLNEVQRELAEFDRINAEAIARVNVENREELRRAMADLNAWGRTRRNAVAALAVQGQAALARAIFQLKRWGRMHETAVADLRVTGGQAGMNMLRQWSQRLRNVSSDVDALKRRMPSLGLQAAHLAGDFQRSGSGAQFASNGMRILGTQSRQASGGVRYLGSSYRSMSRILMNPNVPNSAKALVVGLLALKGAGRAVGLAMMGLHAAIVPLAAGGIAAAGALGGMAVASGAVGIVLKGLSGVFTNTWGAAERYNQAVVNSGKNSKEAKDALKELEATVGQGGAVAAQAAQKYSVFKQALAKALQPATLNLWRAMNVVYSNAIKLVPAYAAQVNNASQALLGFFKWITQAPRIAQMNTILQSMTGIWGPLGDAARSVATILLNIAQVAMPYLISAVKLLAGDLGRLAGALNVQTLSAAFAVMYQWLLRVRATALLAGKILTEFFRQVLPHAARAHDLLQKIGEDLLGWMKSESGRRTIRDFFDAVVPLADKVLRAVGAIARAFITWYPIISTVLGPLADIVKFLADRLTDVGNFVKGLPGPFQTAFGLIALAIYALLPVILKVATSFLLMRFFAKRAAAGVAAAIGGSAAAQSAAGATAGGAAARGFTAALAAGLTSVGGIITAVIAASAASVGINKIFTEMGKAAADGFGLSFHSDLAIRVADAFRFAFDSLKNTMPQLGPIGQLLAGFLGQGIKNGGGQIREAVKLPFGEALTWIKQQWTAFTTWLNTTTTTLLTTLKTLWAQFTTWFNTTIWTPIKTAATTAWNWVKTAASTALIGIKAIWYTFIGFWILLWNLIKAPVIAVWNALRTAATVAMNAIKGVATGAVNFIVAKWNSVVGFLSGIWGRVRAAATAVWNSVSGVIRGAVNGVVNFVRARWNSAVGFLTGIWNRVRGAAARVWNAIKSAVMGPVNSVVNAVRSKWNSGAGILQGIWNRIKGVATSAWNAIKQAIIKPIEDALNKVKETVEDWVQTGRDIVNGIIRGIEELADRVATTIGNLIHHAYEVGRRAAEGHSPSRLFAQIGLSIGQGLALGIAQSRGLAVRAMQDTVRALAGAARRQPFPNSVLNRGTTAETDLRDAEITSKELAEALKNDLKGSVNTFAQKINELVDKLRENNQQIRFLNSQAMVSREMMNRLLRRQLYQPYVNGSILRGSDVDFEKSPVTAAPHQTFNIHTPGNAAMDHVTAATAFGQLIRYQGIT